MIGGAFEALREKAAACILPPARVAFGDLGDTKTTRAAAVLLPWVRPVMRRSGRLSLAVGEKAAAGILPARRPASADRDDKNLPVGGRFGLVPRVRAGYAESGRLRLCAALRLAVSPRRS